VTHTGDSPIARPLRQVHTLEYVNLHDLFWLFLPTYAAVLAVTHVIGRKRPVSLTRLPTDAELRALLTLP
jgi:hypothetical protein